MPLGNYIVCVGVRVRDKESKLAIRGVCVNDLDQVWLLMCIEWERESGRGGGGEGGREGEEASIMEEEKGACCV